MAIGAAMLVASVFAPATLAGVGMVAAAGAGAYYMEDQKKQQKQAADDAAGYARAQDAKLDAIGPAPSSGGDIVGSVTKRQKTSGRASTVQAGSLVPDSIGYKTLLG